MLDYCLASIGFIASIITIVGLIYAIMRNFKSDINAHIDKLEKRIDSLEERMFYMATGKTLAQALLDENIKKQEGK